MGHVLRRLGKKSVTELTLAELVERIRADQGQRTVLRRAAQIKAAKKKGRKRS